MTLNITYKNGKVQTIERVTDIKERERDGGVVIIYYGDCGFQKTEKKHITNMEVTL
jgi:hypothetical protein